MKEWLWKLRCIHFVKALEKSSALFWDSFKSPGICIRSLAGGSVKNCVDES